MFIKSRFKSAKVHIRLMCDIARTFRLSRLPDRPIDPLLRHLTSSPSTSDSLFNWWKILRQGPTGTRQKLEGMEEIFLLPCNKYRKTRLTARTTTYFYALFTLSKKTTFFQKPPLVAIRAQLNTMIIYHARWYILYLQSARYSEEGV